QALDPLFDSKCRYAQLTPKERDAFHDAVYDIHIESKADGPDYQCGDNKEEQEHLVSKRFLKRVEKNARSEHLVSVSHSVHEHGLQAAPLHFQRFDFDALLT